MTLWSETAVIPSKRPCRRNCIGGSEARIIMRSEAALLRLWHADFKRQTHEAPLFSVWMSRSWQQYPLLQSVLARERNPGAFEGVSHFLNCIIRNASPLLFEINYCRKP